MSAIRSPVVRRPLPPWADRLGLRSLRQVTRDVRRVLGGLGTGQTFQIDLASAGLLRPDLSIPAYLGRMPADGRAPVYNLFDRASDGAYRNRGRRRPARDFRGGRLSYEDHDGTDFVCPVGTPLVAAAPGTVVLVRDQWLRGGLTLTVDHGGHVLTQYSHLSRVLAPVGRRVGRGAIVGLSGASGVDMTSFFPWVPPHIHFMAWYRGRPVDPFLADGEARRSGTWARRNTPEPAQPGSGEAAPATSPVDRRRLEELVRACQDPGIARELAARASDTRGQAALVEDALHHESWAWPETCWRRSLRPGDPADDPPVYLSLPLTAAAYRGHRFADARWTRP